MISRLPALAALAAAALLATACAEATDGSPAGPRVAPVSSGAPTGFPSNPATSAASSPAAATSATSATAAIPTPVTPSIVVPPSSSASVPATWSTATAAAKYLQYVHKGNVDVARFNKLYDKKKVAVKTFTDACGTLAVDQTNFAKALQAGKWPTALVSTVRQFTTQVLTAGYAYIQCSLAPTVAAAKKKLDALPDTSPLANKIRVALNLPTVK